MTWEQKFKTRYSDAHRRLMGEMPTPRKPVFVREKEPPVIVDWRLVPSPRDMGWIGIILWVCRNHRVVSGDLITHPYSYNIIDIRREIMFRLNRDIGLSKAIIARRLMCGWATVHKSIKKFERGQKAGRGYE